MEPKAWYKNLVTQHFISKRKNGNPLKIKNVNFLFAVLSVIIRSSNYFQWCIDVIYLKWLLHLWSYTNSLKLLCRNCSSCILYLFLHLTASIMIFLDTWTNRSFFFFFRGGWGEVGLLFLGFRSFNYFFDGTFETFKGQHFMTLHSGSVTFGILR